MSWKNPIKPKSKVPSFDEVMEEDSVPSFEEVMGGEKKSLSGNGSSNGQEAGTSVLPEDEYSGKRPSAYPLTEPQPQQPSGFKTGLNLSQPAQQNVQIAPVQPPKSPVDVLREDYNAYKVDIDKSLTSTVGDDPAFGQYVQGDSLFNALTDTRNSDSKLLAKYSTKRNRDLDNEFLAGKEALDAKYPQPKSIDLGMGVFQQPKRPDEYYAELDALRQRTDTKKVQLMDAVRDVAYDKALNAEFKKVAEPKFVNKTIGREIRKATGDPTLAREERLEMKGIDLSPAENYYNDKVGYIAKAAVLKKMDDNGVDIFNNPIAKKLFDSVKDGKDKLLNDHKDFTRQQAARLISDEISKDKNWFQLMTGAYTVNDKDIEKYAKKLGIPTDIAKLVHEGDIQTANVFGTFANELAARPGASIGTFIGRPFRREVLGQDPDAIDAHYEALNKRFTTALAESPDAQAQFGNPIEVQRDPTKENFLEDQRNANYSSKIIGNFNWNPAVIANSIANGAGQMIQYGLGGTATGGALRGVNKMLGLASDVEKAKNVGLVTYGFMNSYEQGYQMSRQLVGDDPAKEGQRNVIAALDAGVQAFTEMIFPDYKVTDKLFSIKNSGTQILLDQLAKYGPKALTQQTTKKALISAIKQGVVNTAGDTIKEIAEDQAGLLGDVVISAISNPKSLDDRDLPQEFIQTAITTALAAGLPIGLGEMRQGKHTSGVKKAGIYEIGNDHQTYIAHINEEAETGKVSQPVANRKIAIVNTIADIVKKEVPNVSPVNNNPLSEMDKINYSYNLLHSKMLDEKLEKTTDEVQQGIIEKQLKDLKAERLGILQNADGVDKNFNGQAIYDRDAGKVVAAPEEAVNLFETKTETGTDYTGKDNNFLANKEEGFFTPDERAKYNELMKTPDTEEQAATMVADKKEELKKFATPTAPKEETVSTVENKKEIVKEKIPEGWTVAIGHISKKEGKIPEGEVDWQNNRIMFSSKEHANNPEIVNHEIAHIKVESLPEEQRDKLFDDYVEMKSDEYRKEGYEPEWIKKNNFHREQIAIDYGEYLNGTLKDKKLSQLFENYLGESPNKPKPEPVSTVVGDKTTLENVFSDMLGNAGLNIMETDITNNGRSVINGIDKATPKQVEKIKSDFEELKNKYPEKNLELKEKNNSIVIEPKSITNKEVIPEQTYRTKEEAANLLSDNVLDEKGEPIIDEKTGKEVKKIPFMKNYKTDVEYHDIVTGETKTDKTFKAKEEMANRYKNLQSLIVNCLS